MIRVRLFLLCVFAAFAALKPVPAKADPGLLLALDGPRTQGALLIGRTLPGVRATLAGTPVQVSPEGLFVLGFDRDQPAEALLRLEAPGGAAHSETIAIAERDYVIQRIDGLPERMVTPKGPEVLARIKREGVQKRAARTGDSPFIHFAEGFVWPVTGRISGTYGNQRVLNGEPRRPHYGVDIAAPAGTPVKAPVGGVVTLAEPDMYFEGGLVFVDHGHSVIGVFMHLGSIDVAVGDTLAQGQTLGTVGSTGRSTGAHLDWRMYWKGARVDPSLLVPPMPEPVE